MPVWMLTPPCTPRIDPRPYVTCLLYHRFQLTKFLLRIFAPEFMRNIVLSFSHNVWLRHLGNFGTGVNVDPLEWVGKYSLLFWVSGWICVELAVFPQFGKTHHWSHLDRRKALPASSWVSSGTCVFQGTYLCSWIYWHKCVPNIPYCFSTCRIFSDGTSYSLHWWSIFFPHQSGWRFINFIDFSQRTNFWITFSVFVFCFTDCHSDLYYSFSSACFKFNLLVFLVSSSGNRWPIWALSSFLIQIFKASLSLKVLLWQQLTYPRFVFFFSIHFKLLSDFSWDLLFDLWIIFPNVWGFSRVFVTDF